MVITTFSMIIKEMYVNSSHIDIIVIVSVKICPFTVLTIIILTTNNIWYRILLYVIAPTEGLLLSL